MGFVIHSSSAISGKQSVGGRIFFSLFLGIFGLAGCVMTWAFGRDLYLHGLTYTWTPTECEIVSSSIDEANASAGSTPFLVTFRYSVNGTTHTSETFALGGHTSSTLSELQKLAYRYQPGVKTSCYVDPDDPSRAVIQRASPLRALLIFVPLLFLTIGFGGIYLIWRGPRNRISPGSVSISSQARSKTLPKIVLLFPLIFIAVGLGLTYLFFVNPMLKLHQAASWQEQRCTITAASIDQSTDSDGDTSYSPKVQYTYDVGGHAFRSDVLSFHNFSSGYDSASEVVESYPVGTAVPCYVSPSDPTDVVLRREIKPQHFLGLLPLIFFFAGLLIFKVLRSGSSSETERDGDFTGAKAEQPRFKVGSAAVPSGTSSGPVTLTPVTRPIHMFFGAIFIAVFWNGIVSVFVWNVVESYLDGSIDYFTALFLVPFVLIGLGLIGLIVYTFLAIFNPTVSGEISSARIPLGSSGKIRWEISGKTDRISRLRITVTATEEATYRRGTSTYTDRNIFKTIEVFSTEQNFQIARGEASFVIPASTMHSFTASNNKIVWKLTIHGSIKNWPDINHDYALEVTPAGGEKR